MCWFLTTGFAPPPNRTLEQLAVGRPPLDFSVIHNPSVESCLRPGESYFRATSKHCDCDTALGTRGRAAGASLDLDKHIRKLRAQGWTERKIQRAVEDKQRTSRAHQRASEEVLSNRIELASWQSLLAEVVGGRRGGSALLLIHMYEDGLNERIEYQQETVALEEVSDDWLLSMREDVVYRVIRRE
jgi:hypothetical protein